LEKTASIIFFIGFDDTPGQILNEKSLRYKIFIFYFFCCLHFHYGIRTQMTSLREKSAYTAKKPRQLKSLLMLLDLQRKNQDES